jgi:hypothetical protein
MQVTDQHCFTQLFQGHAFFCLLYSEHLTSASCCVLKPFVISGTICVKVKSSINHAPGMSASVLSLLCDVSFHLLLLAPHQATNGRQTALTHCGSACFCAPHAQYKQYCCASITLCILTCKYGLLQLTQCTMKPHHTNKSYVLTCCCLTTC